MKSKVAELVVESSTTPFLHGGSFGDADTTVYDGLQHETGTEEFLNLLAYELVQILPLVDHRCEHAYFQRRVVGFADGGDGL